MVAKGHHYVSQFYLAGFTDTGKRDGHLWEHDLIRKSAPRRTRPKGTGFETHFYRIEVPNVEPDYIEKMLSGVESAAKEAFVLVHRQDALPSVKDPRYLALMLYVTLMAVRGPRFRGYATHLAARIASGEIGELPAEREFWLKVIQGTGLEAIGSHLDVTDVDLKDPTKRKKSITHLFVKYMLLMLCDLLPHVAARKWTLWISDGTAQFITCDSPLVLLGTYPGKELSGRGGYDNSHTAIVMPLSKRLAIEGRFEGKPGPRKCDPQMVALLNGMWSTDAKRFLYSTDPEFVWANSWNRSRVEVRNREAFIPLWEALAEQRKLRQVKFDSEFNPRDQPIKGGEGPLTPSA